MFTANMATQRPISYVNVRCKNVLTLSGYRSLLKVGQEWAYGNNDCITEEAARRGRHADPKLLNNQACWTFFFSLDKNP